MTDIAHLLADEAEDLLGYRSSTFDPSLFTFPGPDYVARAMADKDLKPGVMRNMQTLFASVEQAFDMGAVAVGATVYYGSHASRRQIQEISEAFQRPMAEGVALLNAIQDVYLDPQVSIA